MKMSLVYFLMILIPQAKIHVLGIPKFPCTTFSDFLKNADNENITSFFKSVQLVINNIKY